MDDPHIMVFDRAQVSLLAVGYARGGPPPEDSHGAGDLWLVKSRLVSIQARYLPDQGLSQKNLYVKALAVGGPFMRNSTLVIGSLGDAVLWDGTAVLEPPASRRRKAAGVSRFSVAGLLKASQSSEGQVVVDLPLNVSLIVQRKRRHVNVVIKMPPLEDGQEGLCGNFNGLAGDDSLELVEGRSNPQVEPQASLFEHSSKLAPSARSRGARGPQLHLR